MPLPMISSLTIILMFGGVCLRSCCNPLPVELNSEPSLDIATNDQGTCSTKKCRQVSARIKKAMNEKVNPCEDFYEYACGDWIKDHPIPRDKLQISSFTELRHKNNEAMKEALVTDDNLDVIAPIKKVKTFFRSCLNTKAIDRLGKQPIANYIRDLNAWSVDKDTGWNSRKWDVFKTLKRIQKDYTSTNLFFTVETIPDPVTHNQEERKNILLVNCRFKLQLLKTGAQKNLKIF